MCLAIPGEIKSINDKQAQVEFSGVIRQVSLQLTPEAKVGDYVIVHTGYALNILDKEEGEETLRLFSEIAQYAEDDD